MPLNRISSLFIQAMCAAIRYARSTAGPLWDHRPAFESISARISRAIVSFRAVCAANGDMAARWLERTAVSIAKTTGDVATQ